MKPKKNKTTGIPDESINIDSVEEVKDHDLAIFLVNTLKSKFGQTFIIEPEQLN